MQQLGPGGSRAIRQDRLIPEHAPVEAPRIQRRLAQFDHIEAAVAQRAGEPPHVLADPGCGPDRQLRVERNLHRRSRSSARTISARGSSARALTK